MGVPHPSSTSTSITTALSMWCTCMGRGAAGPGVAGRGSGKWGFEAGYPARARKRDWAGLHHAQAGGRWREKMGKGQGRLGHDDGMNVPTGESAARGSQVRRAAATRVNQVNVPMPAVNSRRANVRLRKFSQMLYFARDARSSMLPCPSSTTRGGRGGGACAWLPPPARRRRSPATSGSLQQLRLQRVARSPAAHYQPQTALAAEHTLRTDGPRMWHPCMGRHGRRGGRRRGAGL